MVLAEISRQPCSDFVVWFLLATLTQIYMKRSKLSKEKHKIHGLVEGEDEAKSSAQRDFKKGLRNT